MKEREVMVSIAPSTQAIQKSPQTRWTRCSALGSKDWSITTISAWLRVRWSSKSSFSWMMDNSSGPMTPTLYSLDEKTNWMCPRRYTSERWPPSSQSVSKFRLKSLSTSSRIALALSMSLGISFRPRASAARPSNLRSWLTKAWKVVRAVRIG